MQTDPLIDRILRVNHAGEAAAVHIYRGQLCGLRDNPEAKELIYEMMRAEQEHLQFFHSAITEFRSRPSLLLQVWKSLAFGLGYASSKVSIPLAMACTVAIEETIDKHYQEQVELLSKVRPDLHQLIKKITQFRQEELEHRDIGLENEAKKTPCYTLVNKVVSLGCKLGIFIAKRI